MFFLTKKKPKKESERPGWAVTCEKCGTSFEFTLNAEFWRRWKTDGSSTFFDQLDTHLKIHEVEEDLGVHLEME